MHRHFISTFLLILGVSASAIKSADAAEPFPTDSMTPHYEAAADYIMSQIGYDSGYCIVASAGKGRLAYELATRTNMKFIGAELSATDVAEGRTALSDAGYYGSRITLHNVSTLDTLNYRDYAGLLVVCDSIIEDGVCTGSPSEMYRMTRPAGGVLIVGQPAGCPNVLTATALRTWLNDGGLSGLYILTDDANGVWARINRAALPGAGEWTHMWADIGNTACTQDDRITDSRRVLWFGGPGAEVLVDRHHMPNAPLVKGGFMVVPGENRIICVDAYNGYRYWEKLIPDSARYSMVRDTGWICLDAEYVYAASETICTKINIITGDTVDTFSTPSGMDWGYISVYGDELLGSEQVVDASAIGPVFDKEIGSLLAYKGFQPVITSKKLFSMNRNTGAINWTYDNTTVIPNPAICADENAVYFVESDDATLYADADGNISITDFSANPTTTSLVKLWRSDGSVAWREPIDLPYDHVIYLSVADGVVLASGCYDGSEHLTYDFFAHDATNGAELWTQTSDSGIDNNPGLEHGEQTKHPIIIGSTIHHKHGGFELTTGNAAGFYFPTSNCADISASNTHFFSRNNNKASIYPMSGAGANSVIENDVRPGCYLSIIPASGMILLPAYSTGCTCDYSMQTTFGWQPQ